MKKFTKIKCGKLYDGLKAKLQENMEILIEGEKIIEVGRNLACPENTTVIDLLDSTVTPGMIDAHMHTQYFHWKDVYADTVFNSDGYRALATAECARKTLLGGFTTVRSLGWFREAYELDVFRVVIWCGKSAGSHYFKEVRTHFLLTPYCSCEEIRAISTRRILGHHVIRQIGIVSYDLRHISMTSGRTQEMRRDDQT